MSGVLIIKLGALGDCVQAAGAVADIRAHHPGDRITMLTAPAYAPFWRRCPDVDAVITDPRAPRWRLDALWRLGGRLRAGAFKRVYDLQNSGRTAFYRRFLLPDAEWSGRARAATWRAPHPNRAGAATRPPRQRLAAQLAGAGVSVHYTKQLAIQWLAEPVAGILAKVNVRHPYVVLLPGSSARGAHKRWPHYPELAQRLMATGQTVVTVPGPGEAELCRAVGGIMLGSEAEPLDLGQLAGVLAEAAFVIGNDSGPSHMASALQRPGLALFGPSIDPALTGIESPVFKALQVPDLAALPVETVYALIAERLPDGPVVTDRGRYAR